MDAHSVRKNKAQLTSFKAMVIKNCAVPNLHADAGADQMEAEHQQWSGQRQEDLFIAARR
jgi:hypothetical protein